jgi:hypothetical protein
LYAFSSPRCTLHAPPISSGFHIMQVISTSLCIRNVVFAVSDKLKMLCWFGLQWHNVHAKFRKNESVCLKVERRRADILTAWWSHRPTFFS